MQYTVTFDVASHPKDPLNSDVFFYQIDLATAWARRHILDWGGTRYVRKREKGKVTVVEVVS